MRLQEKGAEAQRKIDELTDLSHKTYIPAFSIAIIYTGMGDKDRAFEFLDKAYQQRDGLLSWYLVFDPESTACVRILLTPTSSTALGLSHAL